MGEETWPDNVVRSKNVLNFSSLAFNLDLGKITQDGPRTIICTDCGQPVRDGNVVHLKPETFAVKYRGETFYLERHLCLGCARKRRLVPSL